MPTQIAIDVPDGRSGKCAVETFTIKEPSTRMTVRPGEFIPRGTYKRLIVDGACMMSNTPMEIRTNMPILRAATGDVLINGLGLGMVLTEILKKPDVHSVTVIESREDVIKLVAPTFADDRRVTIIHADAFTWKPPKDAYYDAVWHDIWPDVCGDNYPQMKTLHRRYARRAAWQDSWQRETCQYRHRREQLEERERVYRREMIRQSRAARC